MFLLQHTLPLSWCPSPVKNLAMDLGYPQAGEPLPPLPFTNLNFPGAQEMKPCIHTWRWCWGSPTPPGSTVRPSALGIRWRSPLQVRVKESDVERGIFPNLGAGGAACESDLQLKGGVSCHTVSTAE